MTKPARLRLFSYALLLINTVCWGAALIIVKPAFEVTTPFRFLLYRYVLAIILTLPLLWYFRGKLPKKPALTKQLGIITVLELVGTVLALGALYLGLARTTAIDASLIITTSPIFVTIAGIVLLKEKQERHEWIGLGIAFVGTLLLTLAPSLMGNSTTTISLLAGITGSVLIGNLLVVVNNILTAGYFVSAKRRYQGWPKFFITMVSFYVGAVAFGVLSLGEVGFQLGMWWQLVQLDLQATSVWVASGYMAVFGSIIGLTAYIKGQEGVEASEASLFWYLQPLVYLPLGVWLLHEPILPVQLIALGIILLGVIWAERRGSRRTR